jgi:hypothetical protein
MGWWAFLLVGPRAQYATIIRIPTSSIAKIPPMIRVKMALGGAATVSRSSGSSTLFSDGSLSKHIFFRRNTSSVMLLVTRFNVTSMDIVTSTSAGRMPEHRKPIANVSISVDISPIREIFSVGRGRTVGSEVAILIL